MKGNEFALRLSLHLLYYKCHKINPNHDGSYIDFLNWIKSKKASLNTTNKKENKYFQYTVTATLNHEEIKKKYLQRI